VNVESFKDEIEARPRFISGDFVIVTQSLDDGSSCSFSFLVIDEERCLLRKEYDALFDGKIAYIPTRIDEWIRKVTYYDARDGCESTLVNFIRGVREEVPPDVKC
jgi:hypothetical protein